MTGISTLQKAELKLYNKKAKPATANTGNHCRIKRKENNTKYFVLREKSVIYEFVFHTRNHGAITPY